MKCYPGFRNWTNVLEGPKWRKMDTGFYTWNFRSLYRAGSLKTVASELAKCNFVSCAVWVRNLVPHLEEGTQTEGF
jgi:hypothetical protein